MFTTKGTNKILAKKKAEAFYKIFTILDSDSDGLISAQFIDITRLDTALLEVMSPLFIEIEELGQALDAEEFCEAIGRLYDTVTLPEKDILLLRSDKRQRSLSNQEKHERKGDFHVS